MTTKQTHTAFVSVTSCSRIKFKGLSFVSSGHSLKAKWQKPRQGTGQPALMEAQSMPKFWSFKHSIELNLQDSKEKLKVKENETYPNIVSIIWTCLWNVLCIYFWQQICKCHTFHSWLYITSIMMFFDCFHYKLVPVTVAYWWHQWQEYSQYLWHLSWIVKQLVQTLKLGSNFFECAT